MTPGYIRDAYTRRGFVAAMAAAKASMDSRLVDEVMLASLAATGVAHPRTVVVVRKRAGTPHVKTTNKVLERCGSEKLAELRTELARREARTERDMRHLAHAFVRMDERLDRSRGKPKHVEPGSGSTGRLTAEEVARRQAALRNAA
ncbi:MAG: hypothetical protein Q8P36_00745 [bacterium]|nr:hypothetical protein [bacterium]